MCDAWLGVLAPVCQGLTRSARRAHIGAADFGGGAGWRSLDESYLPGALAVRCTTVGARIPGFH